MKTYILQLDPYDDAVSTRDKMNSAQDGRIILVWPERRSLLRTRLDLVLVQRHSRTLGSQLALVTRDHQVRQYARELGIPIFGTLRKAQTGRWRARPPKQPPLPLGASREPGEHGRVILPPRPSRPPRPAEPHLAVNVIAFTIGVLAFLAIAATLLPSAELRLTPQVKIQDVTLSVQANPELEAVQVTGQVPASVVRVVVEGRDVISSTGSMVIPALPATGLVRFTNLTDQLVRIPSGAILRPASGEGVAFATTQAAQLSAGPGITVTLPVQALAPGRKGNLPAGALNAIDGALGTQVAASNPQPTLGGSDLAAVAPTETDRRQLFQRLLASLQATALAELHSRLTSGDLLMTPTMTLTQVLSESYTPAGQQPADQLNLELRLEYAALKVSGEQVQRLVLRTLDAGLPAGFSPLADTLQYENASQPTLATNGLPTWELHASRQLQAQLPRNQAVQLALGQPPTTAEQRLAGALPLSQTPEIALTPAWWPRLPVVPFRITVLAEK